jgi:hypothetical protein
LELCVYEKSCGNRYSKGALWSTGSAESYQTVYVRERKKQFAICRKLRAIFRTIPWKGRPGGTCDYITIFVDWLAARSILRRRNDGMADANNSGQLRPNRCKCSGHEFGRGSAA